MLRVSEKAFIDNFGSLFIAKFQAIELLITYRYYAQEDMDFTNYTQVLKKIFNFNLKPKPKQKVQSNGRFKITRVLYLFVEQ